MPGLVGRPARAAALGLALVTTATLVGCTIGGTDDGSAPAAPPSTTQVPDPTDPGPTVGPDPDDPPGPDLPVPTEPPLGETPPPPAYLTEAEALIDSAGVTDADVGYPRLPGGSGADEYGLGAPTQDQCEEPDASDATRVARVQHWWQSDGGPDGSEPVVVISSEIVVYEPGTAAAAVAALAAAPETCPSKTLEDGSTITYATGEVPRVAAPGAVALTGTLEGPDGVIGSMIIAQAVGDVVGYVYVLGVGPTVLTESARMSAIMQAKISRLAPQLAPGLPG